MDKQLHIVTHDVPWPADFGGVVDLFYKIKSLHAKGIKIHLHCFMQNRPEQNMLNRLCVSVTYYPRKKNWQSLSFRLPYIVKSRSSIALYENLSRDNHPILFEGIHCTYLLSQKKLINRKIMVRLHNVEYEYYGQLARNETHIFKKIYFYLESKLLRHYERALAPNFPFIAVSTADALIYKYKLNAKQVEFLPVFIPWNKITSEIGLGSFCLYQGNLEISENQQAAEWLLNHVFKNVKIPFVIAGKNPPLSLQKKAHELPHTCMVINPSEFELQDLIKKAQVNILPSFNKTGVKLKILNALFNGRHCLVNKVAVEGAAIGTSCNMATDADSFRKAVETLFTKPFTETSIVERAALMEGFYNNNINAEKLITWIW